MLVVRLFSSSGVRWSIDMQASEDIVEALTLSSRSCNDNQVTSCNDNRLTRYDDVVPSSNNNDDDDDDDDDVSSNLPTEQPVCNFVWLNLNSHCWETYYKKSR